MACEEHRRRMAEGDWLGLGLCEEGVLAHTLTSAGVKGLGFLFFRFLFGGTGVFRIVHIK